MIINFEWPVRPVRLISGASDISRGSRFLAYEHSAESHKSEPLASAETSALFRKFAELPEDEDAVKAFASRHGLLGGTATGWVWSSAGTEDLPGCGGRLRGESLGRWFQEVQLLRAAVRVWDARAVPKELARAAWDLDDIADWLWRLNSPLPDKVDAGSDEPLGAGRLPEYRRRVSGGMPDPQTTREEGERAARHLAGKTSARERALEVLRYALNEALAGRISVSVRLVDGTLARAFRPDCLRTALWFQFANAVCYQAGYSECELCGDPFEVSTRSTGHRKSKRYCSTACKSRAQRQRANEKAR